MDLCTDMCGCGINSGTSVWKEGDPVVSRVLFLLFSGGILDGMK